MYAESNTFKAKISHMKKLYIFTTLLFLIACKKTQDAIPYEKPNHFIPYTKEVVAETYHADTAYKYENRVGISGDYQYNYDVSGTDTDGNEVSGNITVRDKFGAGTLNNFEGNEIEIETEWIGYGKLKATDNDGNEYELGVD